MADDIITRDSQGNLAVNMVSGVEANVPYNYDDCFTLDTNNRRALRVVVSIESALKQISGYDATKNQTLKNIAGTFTWVDDE